MSYTQMMKWNKKHWRGTRQPVLFHTNSGFWPSKSWLEEDWWPYLKLCNEKKIKPLEIKAYYGFGLGGLPMTINDKIQYTQELNQTKEKLNDY